MKISISSFISFLKKEKFPSKDFLMETLRSKTSPFKVGFLFLCLLTSILFLSFLVKLSDQFSIQVPSYGGTLKQGVVGAPHFINPLLSASETDQDLVEIIFAGLVSKDELGNISPRLAKSIKVSPDEKEYIFEIPQNLTFSNKKALTISDIIFSFETKKSLAILSDPSTNWNDINISSPNSNEVIIKTTGSADFLKQNLDLGIVSKSIWQTIPLEEMRDSSLNLNPIGAGPFVLKKIFFLETIPNRIILVRNKNYIGKKAFLSSIEFQVFANQNDLKNKILDKKIDSTSALNTSLIDSKIKKSFNISNIPTNESIGLFVSSDNLGLPNTSLLKVIGKYIDRKKIIDNIENGYGIALGDTFGGNSSESADPSSELAKLGYTKNSSGGLIKSGKQVEIPIMVKKEDDLLLGAQSLSQELSNFGIIVELKVFDQGIFDDQLTQGQYPFVFGLNTDIKAKYQTLIPLYTKVVPQINAKDVYPAIVQNIDEPGQEFSNIYKWYKQTDKVWKWFK